MLECESYAAQSSGLLFTKLNRPPVTADWVDRPRLIEQLNHGLQQGPLTLVCASAGFGKTTLVSSWIESLAASGRPPTPAAWLSLDESDSDLMVFLRYFVAAIRTVFPESCAETFALLRAPTRYAQMPLVVALGNEHRAIACAACVLVLDDYYTIRDEAVHDFLSELLRQWPQRLHLVLISRSNPPLPLANCAPKARSPRSARSICVSRRRRRPRSWIRCWRAAQPIRDSLARRAPGGLDRRSASGVPVVGRAAPTRKVSWPACRAAMSRLPTIWWTKSWPARRPQSCDSCWRPPSWTGSAPRCANSSSAAAPAATILRATSRPAFGGWRAITSL